MVHRFTYEKEAGQDGESIVEEGGKKKETEQDVEGVEGKEDEEGEWSSLFSFIKENTEKDPEGWIAEDARCD